MLIAHIARAQEWEAAQESGEYKPAEFEADTFIHCSAPEDVKAVAEEYFTGQDGLVLLWIDAPKVNAGVLYERAPGQEVGDLYPHIYGPLNVDAVVTVSKLKPWEPGGFVLPRPPAA
jgi:uncharacterized protein (DUF952 family)